MLVATKALKVEVLFQHFLARQRRWKLNVRKRFSKQDQFLSTPDLAQTVR